MMTLIIKSYLSILLSLGLSALTFFVLGVYYICNFFRPAKKVLEPIVDFTTIAGDDITSTQLDLAKALIEADRKAYARDILQTIIDEERGAPQQEAQRLLDNC